MISQAEIEGWARGLNIDVCIGQLYAGEHNGTLPYDLNALVTWGNTTGRRNPTTLEWNCKLPTEAKFRLTQEEAACVIGRRPDLLPFFGSYGWDISPSNYIRIVLEWWYVASGRDAVHNFHSYVLDSYLKAIGCRAPAAPPAPTYLIRKNLGDPFAVTLGWAYSGPMASYTLEIALGVGGASAFSPSFTITREYTDPGALTPESRELRLTGNIPSSLPARVYDVRGRLIYLANPIAQLVAEKIYGVEI